MKVVGRHCNYCDRRTLPEREGGDAGASTRHVHVRTAAIVGVTKSVHNNDTTKNRKHTEQGS
jgi:hypothetical protein